MRSSDRSPWRRILLSLVQGLLIAASAPLVYSVAAYLMLPPRANPDPSMFVLLAAIALGPGIVLGRAARRARSVPPLDLGRVGTRVFVFAAVLISTSLYAVGLYLLFRFVRAATAH